VLEINSHPNGDWGLTLTQVEGAEKFGAPANREREGTMKRLAKLTCVLSLSLAAIAGSCAAHAATLDEQIAARFNALEKENAALRARINRLETSKAAIDPRARLQNANDLAAGSNGLLQDNFVKAPNIVISKPQPRFEISGSLLYLQPGAGNLEYGTLVNPLPPTTPHWTNQSLKPDFSPAFNFGLRYRATEADDIQLNWTHLNTTANASFGASPTQMVGPPYLIGPESGMYSAGSGAVQSKYDAVHLDGGHTFCTECPFQMRVFGGVEVARIGQNLSGLFESADGTAASGYTTTSSFTGAGPRLGFKGQYALGDVQFIGEMAAAALIGPSQGRIDFFTNSPTVGPNNQSLTSPNATQVIPSIDARLATAYSFPASTYGQFRVELGYQAAVYFNAVSQYSLTQVPTSLMLPPVGIFLATAQHLQSNFTTQGPYVTGSWAF
jgi:Legionella pneumophila major outer membrane protein precursor